MKTKLTGVDRDGNDHALGEFSQGVVIEGNMVVDTAGREILLVKTEHGWVTAAEASIDAPPSIVFRRIFVQGV